MSPFSLNFIPDPKTLSFMNSSKKSLNSSRNFFENSSDQRQKMALANVGNWQNDGREYSEGGNDDCRRDGKKCHESNQWDIDKTGVDNPDGQPRTIGGKKKQKFGEKTGKMERKPKKIDGKTMKFNETWAISRRPNLLFSIFNITVVLLLLFKIDAAKGDK